MCKPKMNHVNMNVSIAHQALSKFSNENAGIGISKELIRRLITDQLQRLDGHFNVIESNQRFKNNLKMSFQASFNTAKLAFKFVNSINGKTTIPRVEIANLKCNIKGFLEGKLVAEIGVEYSNIIGNIQLIDKRINITLSQEIHNLTSFNRFWESDPKIKDCFDNDPYKFVAVDWDQLVTYFNAISIFSGGEIAETFINSLNLPDIFKIFNGVKFGNNGKLETDSTGELLMFTADSQINFNNCPTFNATGQTQVKSNVYILGNNDTKFKVGEAPEEGNLAVETMIDPSSPTLNYPVKNDAEMIRDGDIFLFTPINLLRVNFDIVKPSVTASDTGNFGPIYWRYSVTSAATLISLKLVNSWPIEFQLSLRAEVIGQAGAGIKIGCIRIEPLGSTFNGEIEPFDIRFKICMDWASRQIVFISKIEKIEGRNFSFTSSPVMFPISKIIDFILGKVSEELITEQADRILSVTRIPIANLNIVNKFAEIIQNALTGESDGYGNATIGVKFKLQK